MNSISTILVALDFSDNSDRALDVAIDYAKRVGADIELVHAFDIPIPAVYPYEVTIPDSMITESRRIAEQKLQTARAKVDAAGISVATHLAEVPAASAIVRIAEDVKADLLVMGTRGHTGLKHMFLGSVAERTTRHAPCSVLVVK